MENVINYSLIFDDECLDLLDAQQIIDDFLLNIDPVVLQEDIAIWINWWSISLMEEAEKKHLAPDVKDSRHKNYLALKRLLLQIMRYRDAVDVQKAGNDRFFRNIEMIGGVEPLALWQLDGENLVLVDDDYFLSVAFGPDWPDFFREVERPDQP